VLVIGAVPQFDQVPNCLRRSLLRVHPASNCGHLSPAAAEIERAPTAAEREALQGLPVSYFDAGTQVCAASGSCDVYVNGRLVYRDGAHLSVEGSMIYVDALQAAVQSGRQRDPVSRSR
jgi:hypothetical protein